MGDAVMPKAAATQAAIAELMPVSVDVCPKG